MIQGVSSGAQASTSVVQPVTPNISGVIGCTKISEDPPRFSDIFVAPTDGPLEINVVHGHLRMYESLQVAVKIGERSCYTGVAEVSK